MNLEDNVVSFRKGLVNNLFSFFVLVHRYGIETAVTDENGRRIFFKGR